MFTAELGRGEDARSFLDNLARGIDFWLEDNPWECPPASVVRKGIDWMKKYYDELERADPVLIDARKVVFIGESGAGKTSLMKSIMAGKGQLTREEERETVGVSVQGHLFRNGTDVKFYDLAGQVEYYGLHQLFLTETALYVLVWDAWKYRDRTEALVEHLNEWLTTLHLRAPGSTVLLCATHKDKCMTGLLANLRGSQPFEEMLEKIERSIRDKYDQWKHGGITGVTTASMGDGVKLENGIEFVSSSPSAGRNESGLSDLKCRLEKSGKGTRCFIPPSWRLALVVLDAVRDGIEPMEAARRFWNEENPLQPEPAKRCTWVSNDDIRDHWTKVLDNYCTLPMECRPGDPEFVLESAKDLRESGGSLLRHPEGVFLDVEDFALSLAPVLNHKIQQKDRDGMDVFAGRKLDSKWMLDARDRLVKKGVLEPRFALYLWDKDGSNLPEQTFDILVKLGILLPLPKRQPRWLPGIPYRWLPGIQLQWLPGIPSLRQHEDDFLVLMRLPLTPTTEIMARFDRFKQLGEKWGIVAKWEFDRGSAPHGLIERLIASCHAIGHVVPGTYWRRGACFIANMESAKAGGGSFALSVHFDPRSEHMNIPKAGTLVVQVFGHRDGRAVWGALRFVISCAWRLFEEFPGLGWEAWVECPTHRGPQLYLAGGGFGKGKSPGDLLVCREAPMQCCTFPRVMTPRLGKVLGTLLSLAEVFRSADGNIPGVQHFEENQFVRDLGKAMKLVEEELAMEEEQDESDEVWNMPEWLKDAIVAGPAGAIALYETWSPLFQVADRWRGGAYEEAIPLTIFAVVLAAAVIWSTAIVFRKLRLKYRWLPPRRHAKSD